MIRLEPRTRRQPENLQRTSVFLRLLIFESNKRSNFICFEINQVQLTYRRSEPALVQGCGTVFLTASSNRKIAVDSAISSDPSARIYRDFCCGKCGGIEQQRVFRATVGSSSGRRLS